MVDILRLALAVSSYLRHHGVEQLGLFGGCGGDLLFECVAQRYQLIDFGDDAVLFGERWEWNQA
jgi:hypothetical protein